MEDINYTDDGSTSLAIYGMPSAAVTCRVENILYVLFQRDHMLSKLHSNSNLPTLKC